MASARRSADEKSTRLERIKELAVIGMFSDDTLMETLVLKGGNALDLIYKLSARASVDVDFSMQADFPGGLEAFRDKVQASLSQTYAEAGFRAFDFKVEDRPPMISESLKSFWGGYVIEFKLIEEEEFEKYSDDLEALRRNAIDLGEGTKFLIDVSRFEHIPDRVERDLHGYAVFVYSAEMILAEKLRALCQQMKEYGPIVKRDRPGTSRARDFIDIYLIATEGGVDMTLDKNRRLLENVFDAKRVPLGSLDRLPQYKAFHEASFDSVKDTLKSGHKLHKFDFYFDFVIDLVGKLKTSRNV
jgi:predicted nucleotidyltransferase component of viral defense system